MSFSEPEKGYILDPEDLERIEKQCLIGWKATASRVSSAIIPREVRETWGLSEHRQARLVDFGDVVVVMSNDDDQNPIIARTDREVFLPKITDQGNLWVPGKIARRWAEDGFTITKKDIVNMISELLIMPEGVFKDRLRASQPLLTEERVDAIDRDIFKNTKTPSVLRNIQARILIKAAFPEVYSQGPEQLPNHP